MKDYTDGPTRRFFALWWRKGAPFVLVLVAIAVFTGMVSYQSLVQGLALDARGVVVTATATDREKRRGSDDTNYYVTFAYDADGVPMELSRKVSASLYNALPPGTTRDIRYLPEAPRVMEYTIGKSWKDGQVMRWISLVAGLGALGVFWWTARPVIEALRARKYGRAEWAEVLGLDELTLRSKYGKRTYYSLVWRDAQGGTGQSMASTNKDRYSRYEPTSDIEVYRDSRGKTWWIGDLGPRDAAPTVPDAGQSGS